MLTNSLNHLSLHALLNDAVVRIKRDVRPLPISFHDPLRMGIRNRGKVTESVLLEFVDGLALLSSTYRLVPTLP